MSRAVAVVETKAARAPAVAQVVEVMPREMVAATPVAAVVVRVAMIVGVVAAVVEVVGEAEAVLADSLTVVCSCCAAARRWWTAGSPAKRASRPLASCSPPAAGHPCQPSWG